MHLNRSTELMPHSGVLSEAYAAITCSCSSSAHTHTHIFQLESKCGCFTVGFSYSKICPAPLPLPPIKPLSLHFECVRVLNSDYSALSLGGLGGRKLPTPAGSSTAPPRHTHTQHPASVTHSGLNATKGRITVTLLPW